MTANRLRRTTDRALRAPRVAVAVSADGVRTRVDRRGAARLAEFVLHAEGVRDAMLSIAFVTPHAIAAINRTHLGHRGSTDVIAFGHSGAGTRSRKVVVGDVYVCPAVARMNAARFGVPVRDELRRLVVHGTLHVLGWDHATDDTRESSKMWTRQERLLRAALRAEARR